MNNSEKIFDRIVKIEYNSISTKGGADMKIRYIMDFVSDRWQIEKKKMGDSRGFQPDGFSRRCRTDALFIDDFISCLDYAGVAVVLFSKEKTEEFKYDTSGNINPAKLLKDVEDYVGVVRGKHLEIGGFTRHQVYERESGKTKIKASEFLAMMHDLGVSVYLRDKKTGYLVCKPSDDGVKQFIKGVLYNTNRAVPISKSGSLSELYVTKDDVYLLATYSSSASTITLLTKEDAEKYMEVNGCEPYDFAE